MWFKKHLFYCKGPYYFSVDVVWWLVIDIWETTLSDVLKLYAKIFAITSFRVYGSIQMW